MTRRPLLPRSARLKRTTHARTPSAIKSSESPVSQLGPVQKPRDAATEPVVSRWVTSDERDDMYEFCLPGGQCCDDAATLMYTSMTV